MKLIFPKKCVVFLRLNLLFVIFGNMHFTAEVLNKNEHHNFYRDASGFRTLSFPSLKLMIFIFFNTSAVEIVFFNISVFP